MKAKSLSLLLISFLMLVSSCRPLQTARIKQDVTLDTHLKKNVEFNTHKTMIVLTLAQEEKTLSKTTLSANEATADIFSLELLNRGCKIVDRANINDFMKENKIKLQPSDLTKILEMGRLLDANFLILTNLFENLQASHALTFLPGQVLTSIDTSANIGVSARMIDLKSGQVVWVGIATTQDQNFQMAIQRIVAKLIQSLETPENE